MSKSDSFADLLNQIEPVRLSAGEVIDATVIAKSKSELWVDVAGASTGFIPAAEVGESGKAIHAIEVGSTVHASVLVPENDEGYAILSVKRAARDQVWVNLAERFESKDTFPARVVEANAGGLLLDAGGIRGFLPVSQLAPEHYPRVSGGDRDLIYDKLSKLVNTDLHVQVLDMDQPTSKLILSEKLARSQETEAALSRYSVGDTVQGKVTGVVDFGAFVSFDGLEGLIHISEIDWNRVNDPRDHLKVGDEIDAKIISIDGAKVSLSLKRMKNDPWLAAANKYKEGQKVKGEVIRVTPFGAFVQLDSEVSGLAHVSELSEEHVENPQEVVEVGDTREFVIISIEPDVRRIALSIKALTDPSAVGKKKAPKDLSGLSSAILTKLSDAGYGDMAKLKTATVEELEAIPGIGPASAKTIKDTIG